MTLAEFLLARLAEDEAKAREPWLWILSDVQTWWDANEDEAGFFADDQPDDVKGLAKTLLQIETARGTYARVLATCEAKRRIVELHTPRHPHGNDLWPESCPVCAEVIGYDGERDDHPCDTLRALAAIWTDHPDYDESWRP